MTKYPKVLPLCLNLRYITAKFSGIRHLGILLYSFQNADSAVLQLDLSDLCSMKSKVGEAAAIFGRIDILVNNAGISYRGCIEDTTLDVDQSLMTVNYFGQVALTKGMLFFR